MANFHNIFACLVHESRECVVDLVRNLRYHDPSSTILLYNGGKDPNLLTDGFPFERYGAVIHPNPRPLEWGRLHDFALDSARYAFDCLPFDTMTIVDSDQLATRSGYSDALASFLSNHPDVGMIASDPGPQAIDSQVHPVITAYEEFDLWRPFLQRFPNGEDHYVHWTFWPGTVMTRTALRDLVRLFDEDTGLHATMAQSRIWATEEILLPTLTALVGHEVIESPFCRDFVQYRVGYDKHDLDTALSHENVFWIHPIARKYGNSRRLRIRERCHHYVRPLLGRSLDTVAQEQQSALIPLAPSTRAAIASTVESIEGWLSNEEANLLVRAAEHALISHKDTSILVEIGSFQGRSTVALGGVVKAMGSRARLISVDPHDGVVGALDQGLLHLPPTLDALRANLDRLDLMSVVTIKFARALELSANQSICFALIDGLHDYVHVALDFFSVEPWLVEESYVAFHDYARYFPGVQAFVDELVAGGSYALVELVGSLILLKRVGKSLPIQDVNSLEACSLFERSDVDVSWKPGVLDLRGGS